LIDSGVVWHNKLKSCNAVIIYCKTILIRVFSEVVVLDVPPLSKAFGAIEALQCRMGKRQRRTFTGQRWNWVFAFTAMTTIELKRIEVGVQADGPDWPIAHGLCARTAV
jgi:hypothetical protein